MIAQIKFREVAAKNATTAFLVNGTVAKIPSLTRGYKNATAEAAVVSRKKLIIEYGHLSLEVRYRVNN